MEFGYYPDYYPEHEEDEEPSCDYAGETCLIRDAMWVEQDMKANIWQRFLNITSKKRQEKLNEMYETQGMIGIESCSHSCALRVTDEERDRHEHLTRKLFGKGFFKYGERKKCMTCKKKKWVFEMTEVNDNHYECNDCYAKEVNKQYDLLLQKEATTNISAITGAGE